MWGKLFDYIAQLAGNSILDKSVEAVMKVAEFPKLALKHGILLNLPI